MRLIPDGEKVRLINLGPGTLFSYGDDCIAVKSEYFLDSGKVEAIIVGSGEFFHGAISAEEQYNLMVQPLEIESTEMDYRAGYDFIMALQKELEAKHHDADFGWLDYKAVKALAATYELQDYLADRIAQAVADGELDPDEEE